LFVVATANGGKMTWTFEPSDARISTLPLLRSTSVISPVTTWRTTPPATLGLADAPGDVITTGAPVDDDSVVVVVPGVVCWAHPTATSRSPVPKTVRRVRGFMMRVLPTGFRYGPNSAPMAASTERPVRSASSSTLPNTSTAVIPVNRRVCATVVSECDSGDHVFQRHRCHGAPCRSFLSAGCDSPSSPRAPVSAGRRWSPWPSFEAAHAVRRRTRLGSRDRTVSGSWR
jgi:hypothetical protein